MASWECSILDARATACSAHSSAEDHRAFNEMSWASTQAPPEFESETEGFAEAPSDGSAVREEPVLRVGEWGFYGGMTVLYDGSKSLSNSTVSVGNARLCSSSRASTRPIAIKSVSRDADDESVNMIIRECAILRDLGDCHPHIMPMLYCAEMPTELVLLTHYAENGDLSEYTTKCNVCLEEREVRNLVLQLLSALKYLHGRRIVHGDVKPPNVFLIQSGSALVARLSDFGLARLVPGGENFVHLAQVQGSYGYIPAEVSRRKELFPAADLFALGVIAFRLLASYEPFFPASAVTSPLEWEECCWSPLSGEAKAFVTQLLSVDPSARGTSGALLDSDPWLVTQVVGDQPRLDHAPKPLQEVCFHTLETSREIWRQLGQSNPQELYEGFE